MAENLVAVFSIGSYTHYKLGFFGVRRTLPVMRTLIFAEKRLVVGEISKPADIDASIKRHTPAYNAALVKFAKEKASSLANSDSLDSLLENSDSIAVDYSEVRRINDNSLLLPQIEVDLKDNTVIRFTSIDKSEFKGSMATLKKAMADKFH
jgi:hypothetical protein